MTPDQIHQHAEAIAQQLAEARERLDQANDELWMLRRIALDQTRAGPEVPTTQQEQTASPLQRRRRGLTLPQGGQESHPQSYAQREEEAKQRRQAFLDSYKKRPKLNKRSANKPEWM